MFKHHVLRLVAAISAVLAGSVVGATQAFASKFRDESRGRSGLWPDAGTTSTGPAADSGSVSWMLVLALAVAVVAAAGLVYSVAWRHSHHHLPA
ncbi:hypothetical protein [Terrabacter sp. Root181]|jgi:hypothetical protein|uniref:hypothetical protein n=1 Tax=Terrabacter sp. Root181 TaxID=1736484 RepID=UPI0006F545ED|nr:hypothetical protein [Terrabacter sp. Root181]KRB43627.1 hypothetical protein ASD90_18435 [Terrabacter sp. Root181]